MALHVGGAEEEGTAPARNADAIASVWAPCSCATAARRQTGHRQTSKSIPRLSLFRRIICNRRGRNPRMQNTCPPRVLHRKESWNTGSGMGQVNDSCQNRAQSYTKETLTRRDLRDTLCPSWLMTFLSSYKPPRTRACLPIARIWARAMTSPGRNFHPGNWYPRSSNLLG